MDQKRSCGFLIWRKSPHGGDARQFLLMKHHNRWDLPKGHVDGDETDLQCALRELIEETGFAAPDIAIDDKFQFQVEYEVQYRKQAPAWKTVVLYLAELLADREVELTEHPGFEWHDWAPPHDIQPETIDPLLAAVAQHWAVEPTR